MLRPAPGNRDEFWERVSNGGWEPETFAIFDQFIDKQHSYIDLGCWIGPTLLYGCQLAKSAYGVEADPIAYSELCENVAYNQPRANNVRVFNVCIAPRSGRVCFGSRGTGGYSMSSLLFAGQQTTWEVAGLTFEDVVGQNRITDCNFIKIDIEGGEYQILPGMAAYLRIHHPTIHLSLHPRLLGPSGSPGLNAKLKRVTVRLVNALKVIIALRSYKRLYDTEGRTMGFCRLLVESLHDRVFEVVATNVRWNAPETSS